MRSLWKIVILIVAGSTFVVPRVGYPDDFTIYSVYQALDMGNPGEKPLRDYYVNMGTSQGLQVGSTLQVIRKTATYDLAAEKLYKDVAFPIAKLKVIHAENGASIARLESFLPPEKTPAITPRAVMVGDIVRLNE